MQSQLHIKTAGEGDLPGLLALYRQLNRQDGVLAVPDACRILQEFTRYPGSAIFIAGKGETLLSTCALVVVPNLTRGGAPYALIENVVTDTEHRKRGYGRAVLGAAIAAAWQCGCYKIMLLTGSKNPATLRFYQGVGFAQSKTGFEIRRPEGVSRSHLP
jgi:GNAT superfamily N-acetyltransferase